MHPKEWAGLVRQIQIDANAGLFVDGYLSNMSGIFE